MTTRVKICGITCIEDAVDSVELGAAALGFNFYPKSPRYIPPAAAGAIIRQLPPLISMVGVFADEADAEHVATLARAARVNAVQLHGPRFPYGVLEDYSVIRAVVVGNGFELEHLIALQASAFLLDAYDPKLPGGTGKTFDWTLAREAKRFGTVILAGGLNPRNVGEAIRQVRPFAVDVASGVESAPGKKDPEKLRAFFAAVESADKEIDDVVTE